MRQLFSVFFLVTTLTATAFAQNSGGPQEPPGAQSRSSYDGYGGRADVFITGFAVYSNQPSSNGIREQATQAGGAAAGYRFHLSSSSALEGRYALSRNSQKYSFGGAVSSIPAYFSEISGSYVYSLSRWNRIRPFLEGGGGLVLFSPGNYGGATTFTNSVYGGSSTGLSMQAKPMFVYGGGADVPALQRLYLRVEFRDVGYKTPDFGTAIFHTNTYSFAYEPSVGVAYRF